MENEISSRYFYPELISNNLLENLKKTVRFGREFLLLL